MQVTEDLRGLLGFYPSWTRACGGNPSLNSILDAIDNNTQIKQCYVAGLSTDLADVEIDGTADNVQVNAWVAGLTNGGCMLFKDGTWNFAQAIGLEDNLHFKGESKDGTILRASAPMTAVFTALNSVKNIIIENMTIDCQFQTSTSCIQLVDGGNVNILFRNCRFLNVDGTWMVNVGEIVDPTEPWIVDKSHNVILQNCEFDYSTNTTLEQCILVNCQDFLVDKCVFKRNNNTTATKSLSIFGYCQGGRVTNNGFHVDVTVDMYDLNSAIIQHSGDVLFDGNYWVVDDGAEERYSINLDLFNVSNIIVTNNDFKSGYTTGLGGSGVRVYDLLLGEFDGHDTLPDQLTSHNILITDNRFNGHYHAVIVPGQTQVDKKQEMYNILIANNGCENMQGMPFIIGHTDNADAHNIKVINNEVSSWRGADNGFIWVRGNSTDKLYNITIQGNTAPSCVDGTDKYAMVIDDIKESIILGNNCEGAGTREAIKITGDSGMIITNNRAIGGITYDGLDNDVSHNKTS